MLNWIGRVAPKDMTHPSILHPMGLKSKNIVLAVMSSSDGINTRVQRQCGNKIQAAKTVVLPRPLLSFTSDKKTVKNCSCNTEQGKSI